MNERATKKVVVDAGHGGKDPGAINGNIYEKDFNLEVSKYIYNRLKELGIPVYITRLADETLNRDERVSKILNAFGNNKDVILLSNHINSGGGEGAEVVYALRNTDELSNRILNEIGKQGQKMRKTYQRRYPTDSSKDYYFIHRLTGNIEPVLIEYGFIDNAKDLRKLQNDLLNYGEAVVKAVADYSNVPYKFPQEQNESTYIVKRGDTLYSLANKFNTTVSQIRNINNLKSDLLTVGQKLIIPGFIMNDSENGDNTYIVQKGDSLYSIAQKYNVTVDDIIRANNLDSIFLQIGDKLIIPYQNNQDVNNIEQNENEYIVQSGDSLYSIAKRFNTTVNDIKTLNNLNSNLLVIGKKLYIPSNNELNTYVVKSGDTLYSLSKEFNTTVDAIKKLNNLTNNSLNVGQVLSIPR